MAVDYDALIVGARVAGSSLAIRLAQQGRRVLLVDRDTFPSDTISTHGLGFTAVESLRRLGVLEKVEGAGFRRMYRHRAWLGDVFIEAPAGPPGAYTLAPSRVVLDQILLERAVECGAELLEKARVDGLLTESGAIAGATIQKIGGARIEARARVVIGADGKGSQVAKWVEAPKYNEGRIGRPIYYAYFRGFESLPDPAAELFFGSDHVGFCLAMRPDEHILVIEAQPEEFEQMRSNPRDWLLTHLAALPGIEKRMRGASLDGPIRGVRGIENHLRKPYGPGWALTGDAGYVKDPITAYGVGDALLQAFMLAKALGAWFDGAPWEATMSDYQTSRDISFRAFYDQTLAAVDGRDGGEAALDELRAALTNPQDAGQVLRALPRLFDQVFQPMDRFRHGALKNMFEAAREATPV